MAKKTLGEILEFDTFNPESLDVAHIQALSEDIPLDGHVDMATAEKLAVQFLRGADMCSEVLCRIVWWLAKKEGEVQHAHAKAMLVKALGQGLKTAKEKERFAAGDKDYLDACERVARAKAMKKWLENKHSNLISAHYLMKEIAKGSIKNRDAGGGVTTFTGSSPAPSERKFGEQEW